MKTLFLLGFSLISSLAFAEATPEFRPSGVYNYSKEVFLTKKRTAETTSHISTEGQARIKLLKKEGFTCIRKSQQETICQKTETSFPETPTFIQTAVDNYLAGFSFNFSGIGEPFIVFDGANTEWMVYEDVYLGKKKVEMFKIVKTPEGWFASFPVSQEQGIGTLNIDSNDKLGLPLTLQTKENGQTVGYFIKAMFVH